MTLVLEREALSPPLQIARRSTSYLNIADDFETGRTVIRQTPIKPGVVVQNTIPLVVTSGQISGTQISAFQEWQAVVSTGSVSHAVSPKPARAFAALDLIRADDELFREAVENLRSLPQVAHSDAICERLLNLLELYREDYEGRSLSADSLAGFVTFLRGSPGAKRPSISATPTGNLYVSWKDQTSGQKLVLHFTPGGKCRYTALIRNAIHNERLDEHAGSTTADAVARLMDALHVNFWLGE